MENMREREVFARRTPAPATAETRERELVAAAGAPAGRKFRGVTYHRSGKCSAMISEPGSKKKKIWLGTYPNAEVAACAYDLAARSLQGNRAKTNFDYPPPYELIDAVTTAPGRRGPVYPVPPPSAPAPAPAAAPPAAPAPVPFEHAHDFSFKAPPREPAQFPVFPFLQDPSRLVLRTPALAPEPKTEITLVRSIPPKPFSVQAAVAASRRASDPVDYFAPPIHIVAPATEPVPASSAETCFSSTPDPQLTASASSSRRMASNSRHLMLKTSKIFSFKTSKIFSVPTTPTPRTSDDGFTGDNFTGINVPFYFTLPPALPLSALMPLDVDALRRQERRRDGGWLAGDWNNDLNEEE